MWCRARRGYVDLPRLFGKYVEEIKDKDKPFTQLVEELIARENGDTERSKKKTFYRKTGLTDKFLRDIKKPNHSPEVRSVMAIIMGHSEEELSRGKAFELLHAARISLTYHRPLDQVYWFLLNQRSLREHEDFVLSQRGDCIDEKRLQAANEMLYDIYKANTKRFSHLFEHRNKERPSEYIPPEFVLGAQSRDD